MYVPLFCATLYTPTFCQFVLLCVITTRNAATTEKTAYFSYLIPDCFTTHHQGTFANKRTPLLIFKQFAPKSQYVGGPDIGLPTRSHKLT